MNNSFIKELIMWRSVVGLAFVLVACAPTTAPPAHTELPAYADRMEYYVPTNEGMVSRGKAATTGVTRYFHINTTRICYSVEVPGTWEAGREFGAASRLDRKGL